MGTDYRTLAEVAAAFPDRYVLLTDLQLGRHQERLGGRVIFPHTDRDEVSEIVGYLPPGGCICVWCMGRPDEDEVLSVSCWLDESDDGSPSVG